MIETEPPPRAPRRKWVRRLLPWLGATLVLLVAAAWVARREIGDVLVRKLDERLSAKGIFVSWRSADWTPGSGIRVRELALYRDAGKRDRLALLDDVTLIKGDPEWNQWDTVRVTAADSKLTLGSGETETLLEELQFSLQFTPGKAELQECQASFQGLRIEAKGVHLSAKAAGTAGEVTEEKKVPDHLAPSQGLFGAVDLNGLRAVKEWLNVQPEKEKPVLKLDFRQLPETGGLDLAARFEGKEFGWRGQKWDQIQAVMRTAAWGRKSPVAVIKGKVGHAGKTADIMAEFEPASSVLRVSHLDSQLNVLMLTRAFVPGAGTALEGFSSSGTWRVTGKGDISWGKPALSQWSGRVELSGDLSHTSGKVRIALQRPSCALRVDGLKVSVNFLKARLWETELDAPKLVFHLPSENSKARFEAQLAVRNASLPAVVSSFGADLKQTGSVDCEWQGSGAYTIASLKGGGTLSVQNAEFSRLPLVGSLKLVLDTLIPGSGQTATAEVRAAHRMTDGILHLESGTLETYQARIEMGGTIDFGRWYADLEGELDLKGLVSVVTSPLRAQRVVTGKGPLGDVKWEVDRERKGLLRK